MKAFTSAVDKYLLPIAVKINNQKELIAIRDAFMMVFPLTMAGSIVVLINSVLLDKEGFIAQMLFLPKIFPHLSEAQAIFAPVMNGSVNIMAILIAYLIAHLLCKEKGSDPIMGGIASVGSFFIMYPPYQMLKDGDSAITTRYLGAQGLFTAILCGILVGELLSYLARIDKIKITMPESVPPAVARPFQSLIPVIIVLYIVSVIAFLGNKSADGINGLIYSALQAPLRGVGNTLGGIIILTLATNSFWILGIHGSNLLAPIRQAIGTEPQLENLKWAAMHHTAWGAPYPINLNTLYGVFSAMGGNGMTLGLLVAIFIASRRADWRSVAKLSLAPGIFNINEPLVFGLPIVLNPLLIIPYLVAPVVSELIAWAAIHFQLMPTLAYDVPWTTPGPIVPFFGTGGNWVALIVGIVCFISSIFIYLPFVVAGNRAAAISEQEGANEVNA